MSEAPQTPLRQIRLASGLSLREVARRANMNPGRLSVIERGAYPVDDEAARILAALQVTVAPPITESELRVLDGNR